MKIVIEKDGDRPQTIKKENIYVRISEQRPALHEQATSLPRLSYPAILQFCLHLK